MSVHSEIYAAEASSEHGVCFVQPRASSFSSLRAEIHAMEGEIMFLLHCRRRSEEYVGSCLRRACLPRQCHKPCA